MEESLSSGSFPLESLLPLRAVEITLKFLAPAQVHLFHQPALTAFLRYLLDDSDGYDLYLTLDAPESGRSGYRAGDGYRFILLALAGGEALLHQALLRLQALPGTARRREAALPFRDNLMFSGARDLFQGHAVDSVAELSCYTLETLEQEAARWHPAQWIRLRWRSPVRLLLDKAQRQDVKGEARFCRGRADVSPALLADRLHDTLADLLRRRGGVAPARGPAPALDLTAGDLFWVDSRYQNEQGHEQVMGGLMGTLDLACSEGLPADVLRLWVLGQYLGVGQRRAFGWGRYTLETAEGKSTCRYGAPCTSLLERVTEWDNLAAAYAAIRANQQAPQRAPRLDDEEEWFWDDPLIEDEAVDEDMADRLERLAGQLAARGYEPPSLVGVLVREADGDVRPLAIPPFLDRVAQRAVAQVLTPGLEPLMYHGSFGYRPRRSRHGARQMIQAAYEQGYRWVYESDIDDFFDSVDWSRLRNRLVALYGDDPLVALVLRWMAAPVRYENQAIQRGAGLPQGSPLSPLLANLMLDDFDSDLETAGFRLARFADDFVILCKDRDQAEAAARAVVASLAELGLGINQAKTAIRSFNQGFRYLGYLFVDGMALDVSGKRAADPGDSGAGAEPVAPPNSWLAKLLRQTPRRLDAGGRLEPAAGSTPVVPATPVIPAGPVVEVGEQVTEGAMVFVTGAPTLLSTAQGRLQLERDGKTLSSVPWSGLQGVVLIGAHHITTPALRAALAHDVAVHLADQGGRYQGTAWSGQPAAEGCSLWLQQQACFADPANALAASRRVVESRLRHMREVLRQRAEAGHCEAALQAIDRTLGQLSQAADLSALNGFEGYASRVYFEALQSWVPAEFGFSGRNRRPPQDPVNALLSLGYTVLYAHVDTVLRASGLLPWVGFYHQPHGQHAVLASDLMEPFRHLVERTALAAVIRRRLKAADFYLDAEHGCRLQPEALRRYLAMLAERFDTPVLALHGAHPKRLHEHLHAQNLALIAWIRGKAPVFESWRMR